VKYFEGLGLGLIPLALLFLSLRSIGPMGSVGIILYLVEVVAALVCLAFRNVRFIGYGLLTTVIVSPPIAFQVACTVAYRGSI
jgi:hypothetical protein